ncbi:MAG TPA: chemotaxis protein CheD [Lachnospiraceae bacterium]|nr:chemotaxis protein CheD [Lachnospiraceae bacterium]
MERIIGIGEIAVSNRHEDIIKTFSLASCVAVAVYCSVNGTAGMIHVALPEKGRLCCEFENQPCYYAEQGVPLLIDKMCLEYNCPASGLEIELFGGAESIRINDVFQIGRKNISVIKELLEDRNLKYKANEIGGRNSRTLIMNVSTGEKIVICRPLII